MTEPTQTLELTLPELAAAHARDAITPSIVVERILEEIARRGADGVWISVVARTDALARARQLEALPERERKALPLWGVPFSVKDCIDTIGLPTTSACPAFSYTPARNNPAVERLLAAGAILIGKTNMDQFATGLVGVRSPYGVALNPFDPRYIPGGSSSGAAVSVAHRSRQLCARHRYRRLRTRASHLQQCRRPEADPRPAQQHWRRCRPAPRSRRCRFLH